MLKPRLTLCCVLAALAVSWARPPMAGATPGEIHVVDRDAVALRAGPGDSHKVLDRLERDSRVMEFERRGRWLRVQPMGTMGKMGWVPRSVVKPEPPPPPPPAAAPAEPPEPPPPSIYIDDRREIYIIKPSRPHRPPSRKRPTRKPTLMVPRADDPTANPPSP